MVRWNLATGDGLVDRGTVGPIRALVVRPNDGRQVISGDDDGNIIEWSWQADGSSRRRLARVDVAIRALAISRDGTQIVMALADGTVGMLGRTDWTITRHPVPVNAIAFIPGGDMIITAGDDGAIRYWSTATGEQLSEPDTGHNGPVRAVAVTSDGRQVISASADGTIRVLGVPGTAPLISNAGTVIAMTLSPAGDLIIAGRRDGTIQTWDRSTRAQVGTRIAAHRSLVSSVALTPDGLIVSGGGDAAIEVWDPESGNTVGERLTGHTDLVRSVAVTRDGTQIISASADGTVRIWDRATRQPIGAPLTAHTGGANAAVLTPDDA